MIMYVGLIHLYYNPFESLWIFLPDRNQAECGNSGFIAKNRRCVLRVFSVCLFCISQLLH